MPTSINTAALLRLVSSSARSGSATPRVACTLRHSICGRQHATAACTWKAAAALWVLIGEASPPTKSTTPVSSSTGDGCLWFLAISCAAIASSASMDSRVMSPGNHVASHSQPRAARHSASACSRLHSWRACTRASTAGRTVKWTARRRASTGSGAWGGRIEELVQSRTGGTSTRPHTKCTFLGLVGGDTANLTIRSPRAGPEPSGGRQALGSGMP